jgi:hypothetical protein
MYVFFFFTAVMPIRCVRKGYVFCVYIYTLALSCIHVYAHMSRNPVPSFVPSNWPECLINMLIHMYVHTVMPFKLITFGLVSSCAFSILIPTSPRATYK